MNSGAVRKWICALALTGLAYAQPVPAPAQKVAVFDLRSLTSTEQLLSGIRQRGEKFRAVVPLMEGMSLRLPLAIQLMIVASKPEGWLQNEYGVSWPQLAQGVHPAGWWAALPDGEWAMELEINSRSSLLQQQQKLFDHGVVGPSELERCRGNLRNLSTAIEMYLVDHKRLPEKVSELTPSYLMRLPVCPSAGRSTYLLRHTAEGGYRIDCGGDHHQLGPGALGYDSDSGLRPSVSREKLNVSLLRDFAGGGTFIEGGPAWRIGESKVLLCSSRAVLQQVLDCAAGKSPAFPLGNGEAAPVRFWNSSPSLYSSWRPGLGSLAVHVPPDHPARKPVVPDRTTPRYVPVQWRNAVTTDLARPLALLPWGDRYRYLAEAFDGRVTLSTSGDALNHWLVKDEERQMAVDCQNSLDQLARAVEDYRRKKGRLPEKLSQLQNSNGYPFVLCPSGPKLALAYKPKGKNYQLYCPGLRHRGAGLAADHPRAGEKPLARPGPPWLLVALVRDRARAAEFMKKRKQSVESRWQLIEGPEPVLLWAQGDGAEAALAAARDCTAENSMLSRREYQQAGAFHIEVCDLEPARAVIAQRQYAILWQQWMAGQFGQDYHRFSTYVSAVMFGPWLEVLQWSNLEGSTVGVLTDSGLELRRQGGLPAAVLAVPQIMENGIESVRPAAPEVACSNNLKNIATALEMYSTDYQGRYPAKLSQLTPNYLKTIPTCPGADADSYSATYRRTVKPDTFRLHCAGENHAPWPPNTPAYSSDQGLATPR